MSRTLWTVLVDRQPVAVIAAAESGDAWRIVAALADHGDLNRTAGRTRIVPSLPAQARRTLSLAATLGCADTFLACLGGGMFLTAIGGLSMEPMETASAA